MQFLEHFKYLTLRLKSAKPVFLLYFIPLCHQQRHHKNKFIKVKVQLGV